MPRIDILIIFQKALNLTQGCSILLMFQVNRNNCSLKKKVKLKSLDID